MNKTLHKVSVCLVLFILMGFLMFHFSVTLLYVSPPSPIKMRYYEEASNYLEPVFYQDWHLFSPTPPDFDIVLHMKSRIVDRSTGKQVESNWINITTKTVERYQRNRISPLNALTYMLMGTFYQRQPNPQVSEIIEMLSKQNSEFEPNEQIDPDREDRNLFADKLAARVASVYASKLFGANYDISEVKVRWELIKVPRFSQRNNPDVEREKENIESSWMKYEHVDGF